MNHPEKDNKNNDRFGWISSIFMSNVPVSKTLTAEYSSEASYLYVIREMMLQNATV